MKLVIVPNINAGKTATIKIAKMLLILTGLIKFIINIIAITI
jgi:hypothetical protein